MNSCRPLATYNIMKTASQALEHSFTQALTTEYSCLRVQCMWGVRVVCTAYQAFKLL